MPLSTAGAEGEAGADLAAGASGEAREGGLDGHTPTTSGWSAECHGKRELSVGALAASQEILQALPWYIDVPKGRERDTEVKRDELLVCTAGFRQQDLHFHKIGEKN